MKKIIWLASYPKCGNTYLRAFLTHYIFDKELKLSFKNLNKILRFESKEVFDLVKDKIDIDTNFIKKSVEIQIELIKILKQKQLIFKTHHSFGSVDGYNFTTEQNTLLFIYIVRDPREVLISYARHSGISIDKMLEFLLDDKYIIRSGFQSIVNWRLNYNAWKSFKSVPNYFIKYEDLISNPNKIFESLVFFLSRYTDILFDKKRIDEVINIVNFKKMQRLEKKIGFGEAHHSNFFHSGKIDSWKKILTKGQIYKVEKKFAIEMQELGYLN